MTAFLKQVANHYHPSENLGGMCFIFLNKRSISFFKKYLGEICAGRRAASFAPECFTMNDFFARASGSKPADRMGQMITLYDCYKVLNPNAEPLDEFIFWGGILLGDFAEVDKYLVNPDHIFKNVSDYRRIQDSFDYLSEEQKKAMEQFLRQFKQEGEYKERFRRIWDILLPLYYSFNKALEQQGLASEGAIYRRFASRLENESIVDILGEHFPECHKFVFVGLNALNNCEKKVMRKMRDAGIAEFCWDFSSSEIKDPANRSAFFMAKNVDEFPKAFETDPEGLGKPTVNAVSVPSSVGQAKLMPEIFSGLKSTIGINTAIVLPDEGLLLPILNSIPESITDVNVTMGYPVRGSEFYALMKDIASLQLNTRLKDGNILFYHKYVWGIFSNSIIRSLLDERGKEIVSEIRRASRYYIPLQAFKGSSLLEMVFRPAEDIPEYEKTLILTLAPMMKEHGGMQMELQFCIAWYRALTRLQGLNPQVQPKTWFRLIDQLVAGTAVPFNGEPLKGLQIMGPLETRALDFDNLIILSCNEGIFPRRSVAASFIPAELRKGFGLPTYVDQDAVWAYYFYRMIQRAKKVWLLYDSRTELSRSGEESRYIRQLQMLYGFELKRYSVKSRIAEPAGFDDIEKSDADIAKMQSAGFRFSASSIQSYMKCPAKFYYQKIVGLKAADEVSESLDTGMLGNVLHKTMQELYSKREFIERSYLESLMKDNSKVNTLVDRNIMAALKSDIIEGRNLIFQDMLHRYVKQVIKIDLETLKQKGKESFRILGLEKSKDRVIAGVLFNGIIDRLDSFDDASVRVVDYKTGRVTTKDIDVTDENASGIVKSFLNPNDEEWPKIAFQLFIYDELLKGDADIAGKQVQNCIYHTTKMFVKPPVSVPVSQEFSVQMEDALKGIVNEIMNKDVPWTRKGAMVDREEKSACKFCDFKTICGK